MSDRIKSKRFPGVYHRLSKRYKHNGKADKIFCFCYSVAGKLKWVMVGRASQGVTEEYTNQKRIEILNKLNLGENPVRKRAITIDEAVTAYFEFRRANGSNTEADENRYNTHIKPVLGSVTIQTISHEKLDRLKVSLNEKLTPASVKKIFSLVRAAINLAIRRKKHTGLNPFSSQADFTMPKEDNKAERYLTPEEAKRLLHELELRSIDLHDMALISLSTGMRSTEIFGLTGKDIDAEASVANITAKGGVREIVPLPQDILKILIARCTTPDALLFPSRNGKRRTGISDSFSRVVNSIGLNEGITDKRQHVWFHTLRHTFASWLAQSGKVTLHELMLLMRHKRIDMTLRYAHLIPNQQREKLTIVGNILAQNQ